MSIVHDYEDDREQAELQAERRAIQAEEAEMQKERIDDLFDGMKEGMDKLTIRKGEGK